MKEAIAMRGRTRAGDFQIDLLKNRADAKLSFAARKVQKYYAGFLPFLPLIFIEQNLAETSQINWPHVCGPLCISKAHAVAWRRAAVLNVALSRSCCCIFETHSAEITYSSQQAPCLDMKGKEPFLF